MTSPGTPSGPTAGPDGAPALRASDLERHEVVVVLQDAVARGLLTPDEGSDRMAAAWAARHRHDLLPLTADLPRPQPAAPEPPGWRALGTMTWARLRTSARELAAEGPRSPRVIATVVALVLGLLLLVSVASAVLHVLFGGGLDGGGPVGDGFRDGFRGGRFHGADGFGAR